MRCALGHRISLSTVSYTQLHSCIDASIYTANASSVDWMQYFSGTANYRFDWTARFQIQRSGNWITYGTHSGYTTKSSDSVRSFSLSRVPKSGSPHTARVRSTNKLNGSDVGYLTVGHFTVRR